MTTVHRLNAGNLEEIASWAKTRGVTSVNYKPVTAWYGAVDSLLIDDDKIKAVMHEQISKLTHLRSEGGPTIDFGGLNSFGTHSAGMRSFSVPCRQVIREFTIRPNGDVQLCACAPYVGNLRKQTAESIWRGDQAANYRRARANCTREYAVSTTLSPATQEDLFGSTFNGSSPFCGEARRDAGQRLKLSTIGPLGLDLGETVEGELPNFREVGYRSLQQSVGAILYRHHVVAFARPCRWRRARERPGVVPHAPVAMRTPSDQRPWSTTGQRLPIATKVS